MRSGSACGPAGGEVDDGDVRLGVCRHERERVGGAERRRTPRSANGAAAAASRKRRLSTPVLRQASAPGSVAAEARVDVVRERARRGRQLPRAARARSSSARSSAEVGEAEVGESRLARAEQLAAAAQVEVDLRQLEAVGRVDERLQPPRAPSRSAPPARARRAGSTTAPRRGRPGRAAGGAARARSGRPPGRSSPSRSGRRRRPRSPSSRRARRARRALNRAISSRRSGRLQPAVQQPTRKSRSSAPRSRSASSSAARASVVSDASTSGQTTYACRPSREQPRQTRVRLGRALLGDPARHDRLARRRRLRDLGDGEVAVHGERERARDRRRRHVQHVRRASLRERLALLDAEAVLLVDDGDGEVAQLDALLDQRVRADDDVGDTARGCAFALRATRS